MSGLWTPGGERPEPRGGPTGGPGQPAAEGQLSDEERAALEQELAAMQQQLVDTPVEVVVANHVIGLFQLAVLHLNREPPGLAEARLAIDAMAAVVERLAGRLGEHEQTLRDAMTQAQLAFVQVSGGGPGGAPGEGPPGGAGQG